MIEKAIGSSDSLQIRLPTLTWTVHELAYHDVLTSAPFS